jgi:hypothetical protein
MSTGTAMTQLTPHHHSQQLRLAKYDPTQFRTGIKKALPKQG